MGGTPPPPFSDKIFGKKGGSEWGGFPPPPFTDKIRKVVFEVFPNEKAWIQIHWFTGHICVVSQT